ncbi:MAG: ABC transporter permease [Acidobacteria bacterium]|nr:ABC transporter permease [Acidobacteriota bacterium]
MINFSRWVALFLKELRQIGRNRRLIVMLIIPPTVNIVLFGFALNPTVTDLRLGLVDQSRSIESRELISAMTESLAFKVSKYYLSEKELTADVSAGKLDAALIIPADFSKKRTRNETADVQFIVDAVDSNTATIAAGYAARIIAALNQKILKEDPRRKPQSTPPQNVTGADRSAPVILSTNRIQPSPKQPGVTSRVALLYNPGLRNSWFIVTGLIGALLVLQGSIVAAASMVREKEVGTIEQLLMSPAEAGEIITAKIAPIFLLLTADIALALTVARLVFGVPMRGSLLLFFVSGSLCVLSGIGIGTLIATFVGSQQQAQLMSFFVNPPLVLLSGATTPIEAMPAWLQPVTLLNPVRHFATISRGVLLKGTGLEVLYPNFFALLGFCILLVGVSAWQFRRQLR